MSNQETPRSELYRRLRYQHQIRMTPNGMDTIEQFYHENIKGSIKHVGIYRFINAVFAMLMLVGIIIFWNHPTLIQWFVGGSMFVFAIYNGIHLFNNVLFYKSIKQSEPFDDIPSNVKDRPAYGRE